MLQLKDIIKDYDAGGQKVHALQGITVDFRKTEFVSVLGPSGCGKTTLMNIIGGLDKATSGGLFIDGTSTENFKPADWDNYRNKKIGFIFQSYNLIQHLSVLGNVEIALTISGISKDERKRRATEALRSVGLFENLNKKPNQLSGGQMQRVAIARALVNSPEILLADEPTGALDTETSEQIMDLISKIADNRLVIMVTHNPELAERYSTRLIRMIDGHIIEDSQPYDAAVGAEEKEAAETDNQIDNAENLHTAEIINADGAAELSDTADNAVSAYSTEDDNGADNGKSAKNKKPKKPKKERSAMSFATALSLSWKNLLSKKGRTILTAIAGSIGIIGIALIIAISGGMNNYIDKIQSDTLSSNPIEITSTSINIDQAMNAMSNREEFEKFPKAKKIFVEKTVKASDIMSKNKITQEYIDYVKNNVNPELYNGILFKTGMAINVYGQKPGDTAYTKLTGDKSGMMGGGFSPWQLMLSQDFIGTQYDLLGDGSRMPENKNEIVIVVNQSNRISDTTLAALGLKNADDNITEIAFEDVIGKEYKVVDNNLMYEKSGAIFREKMTEDIDFEAAETLKIVGIVRLNKHTEGGVLSTGIGYTQALYDWMQIKDGESDLVGYMNENPTKNPMTGNAYVSAPYGQTAEEKREADYRMFGGETLPNEIGIYPTSFEAKNSIKAMLNNYNTGRDTANMVTYTDMSELLGQSMGSMVDVISYVLIAFTAISLVVSSIMIGVITYISVLERTKEIGILRSIGARKKDVSRIFNAETVIIGFISGVLGIIVTYILSIPINLIVESLLGVSGIASLNFGYAALLILISVVLTVVSGLIPATKASKRDPVTALRNE